jgi:superfamily I DNA and/or RNA helicase
MPPSNYFSGNPYVSNEIEDDDIEASVSIATANIESLLSFGDEQKLTTEYLSNHYRSHHPDLIQFSNYAFYH